MKTISLESYSRKIARELIRPQYPETDWYTHYVHHIDGNPFNNSLENLQVVERKEHNVLHKTGKQRPRPCKPKPQEIRKSMIPLTLRINCKYCGRSLKDGKCLCGRKNSKYNEEEL